MNNKLITNTNINTVINRLNKFISVVICLAILFYSNTIIANNQLPAAVSNALNKHKLPHKSISIYIKEVTADTPVVSYNTGIPRNPASVMKVVTTLAGLELLGPTYVWETRFLLDGKLNQNTLNGDLVIQGGGDPFLVRESFWHTLFTLQLKKLKHINGDLIIDNTLFESEPGSTGDFDKRPYRAYNAFPDAALLNFSAQHFIISPDGSGLDIYSDPPSSTVRIMNNVKIVKSKCKNLKNALKMHVDEKDANETIVNFSGQYPSGCGKREMLRSVTNNSKFLFGVFKSLWETMSGTISGNGISTSTPSSASLFHKHNSYPLSNIIHYINKHSNNVMARQLLLTIARETHGSPASKVSGANAIRDWISKKGIDSSDIIIENGSGLSRKSRIKASTLGDLLDAAWHSSFQPEFLASLPIAGVDGTMKKRLNGHVDRGNLRIKTGLLRDVRSMAGYVTAKSGKTYIVVSLQNHPGVQNWTGTQVQDALLKWLYDTQ